ncbi:MAG: sulfatase-like hydrolase/transferase, partial [Candidatus Aminicenantes bacterium]|nr:sulfatase-like hydrolase/transferase [Candidatus Aminicenantes bacterium]
MAKKKRKKQRRKKTQPQSDSVKQASVQETIREERSVPPKKAKLLYYLVPMFLVVIGILIYFLLLSPKKPSTSAFVVKKDSGLNVLLIIVDTLRADRVGYSGYDVATPNMDFLAADGTRFTNTSCQYPMTLPSHASIMTSTFPQYHGIKNNGYYVLDEGFTTLAEVLKANGYSTSAFIGAMVLDSKFGLAQGFDAYDDTFKTPDFLKALEAQNLAEDVYKSAEIWFEANFREKFFMWVHFYDPHAPYTPPPPYDTKYADPYDGEVTYTDVYIGKLIDMLKEKDLLDKTLVILTSDHGEGLKEHAEVTHGIFLYDTTIHVPLVFRCPGIVPSGRIVEQQVRTVDLMPTVCDILDIRMPEGLQGISLLPVIENDSVQGFESYAETYFPLLSNGWSPLKSIRTQRYKYIEAPVPELYDVVDDPEELTNIINKKPEKAKDLAARLKKFEEKYASEKTPSRSSLSFEEREKLRSLGYTDFGGEGELDKSGLPDPKAKIEVFNKIQQAYDHFWKGRMDRAQEILNEVTPLDPDNPGLRYLQARLYFANRRFDMALQESIRVFQSNSKHTDALLLLGLCYLNLNRPEEAIKELEKIPQIVPEDTESLSLISMAYRDMGDFHKSEESIQKAIAINGNDMKLRLQLAETLDLMNEDEKALAEYEYVLEKDPGNPRAHSSLGIFYMNRGDVEKGIQYMEESVQLSPTPDVYYYLGFAYRKAGRNHEAIQSLKKFLELAPSFEHERKKIVQEALAS